MCKNRRIFLFALLLVLVLVNSAGFAQSFLSANDLEAATLTEAAEFEDFRITAISGKTVVIEALGLAKSAEDGEIFNARIKLGGAGTEEYRSVHFSTVAPATLTVYLNSSSKTDARILKLLAADGTLVAELAAPVDADGSAGMASFAIPAAGSYYLASAGSGINLYLILVE